MVNNFYFIFTYVTITIIMTYFMMSTELPDGKFALKSLHNKLENIRYYIEKKKYPYLTFYYKNKQFNIKVERATPVKGLNYDRLYYVDTYINDELVCRLWSKDCTLGKYRWVETTDKRHSNEIFALINQANKAYKKLEKEDFNRCYKSTMDNKSYFTTKGGNE